MALRIAINGFGRIGRLTFRNLAKNPDVEVVAINDLTDNATLAHLLKRDSVHGSFDGTVEHTETSLIVNGSSIDCSAERDPSKLKWADMKVDVVLECTGLVVTSQKASAQLDAGAKQAVISAPAKGVNAPTLVIGVNQTTTNHHSGLQSNER